MSSKIQTSRPKIFKCPVHGYVSVPRALCSGFIDTPIFQRLRRIEQTSMRPLFPSAHHNRFVHSIGVFHLATVAFQHIVENTYEETINETDLSSYQWVFCIAALMHDCGHAPFSHTFESYYETEQRAQRLLFDLIKDIDDNFISDYSARERQLKGPSEHEIFSSAIFLKHYNEIWEELEIGHPPSLVVRMITGVLHRDASSEEKQVENCLIKLINGPIDLDKLDYIIRDTWASGVKNVSIDVIRLLSSILIGKAGGVQLEPAFNKSALSVIQSVIDGRNFLYQWVYVHHTVIYFEHLLKQSGEKLFKKLSPDGNTDDIVKCIFSEKVFENSENIYDRKFYLPDDGDFYSLLKEFHEDIPEFDEILSRKPKMIPLWKTYAEFQIVFESKPRASQRDDIKNRVAEILQTAIGPEQAGKVKCYNAKPKLVDIEEGEIYVNIRGNLISFTNAVPRVVPSNNNESFYYVFIPREDEDKKQACIEAISSTQVY